MIRPILIAIAVLLSSACTSSRLASEWRDPTYGGGPFEKIMVIGGGISWENRVNYENAVAKLLRSHGNDVLVGHEHFERGVEMKRETVEPVVRRLGVDGVLFTFFLAEAELEGYQHANTMSREFYYDRYQMALDYARSPGYNTSESKLYLASSMYDVATVKEVWSANSETSNPRQDDGVIKSVAPVLVGKLREEGLVR